MRRPPLEQRVPRRCLRLLQYPARPALRDSEDDAQHGKHFSGLSTGSEVSLGHVLHYRFIQRWVRNQLPEPHVLLLHVLKSLGLISLRRAVLTARLVVRLIDKHDLPTRHRKIVPPRSTPPLHGA